MLVFDSYLVVFYQLRPTVIVTIVGTPHFFGYRILPSLTSRFTLAIKPGLLSRTRTQAFMLRTERLDFCDCHGTPARDVMQHLPATVRIGGCVAFTLVERNTTSLATTISRRRPSSITTEICAPPGRAAVLCSERSTYRSVLRRRPYNSTTEICAAPVMQQSSEGSTYRSAGATMQRDTGTECCCHLERAAKSCACPRLAEQ